MIAQYSFCALIILHFARELEYQRRKYLLLEIYFIIRGLMIL